MAVATNTFQSQGTGGAVGNREDLSDMVNRITPEDTPIYSMIRKERASNTYTEWEVDELADPAANAQAEGDDYSTKTKITPPDRMGNYTQIFRKVFRISGTQEAVKNAGQIEKVRRQAVKKGIEIRKDVEKAITDNNASVSGATRELGGLPSWLKTNVSGLTAANATYGGFDDSSKKTVAVASKSAKSQVLGNMTRDGWDTIMQSIYEEGGNARDVVMAPHLKKAFVEFVSGDAAVAQTRNNVTNGNDNRLISNADYYDGPFGMVRVVPNRVMRGTVLSGAAGSQTFPSGTFVFFLDRSLLCFKWLRKIKRDRENVASNADARDYVIIGEGTLKVVNEKGNGMLAAQKRKT